MGRSKSSRASLVFPVARIWRYMKSHNAFRRRRISCTAGVYLTAVLEYLTREVTELAGEVAKQGKRKLVSPRNIMLAIANDEELLRSFNSVILPYSGVVPKLNPALLPKHNLSQTSNSPADVSRNRSRSRTALSTPTKPTAMAVLSELKIAKQTFLYVVRGSVTNMKGDVVIHPTSSSCGFNGQVGRALLGAGGNALQQCVTNALIGLGPLEHCGVRLTPAANISCPYILHCNSPSFRPNNIEESKKDLSTVIERCLEECDAHKQRVLVLPSVGSGGSGYPKDLAAHTIVRAIKIYCDTHYDTTNLSRVYFVLYDKASIDAYTHEFNRWR